MDYFIKLSLLYGRMWKPLGDLVMASKHVYPQDYLEYSEYGMFTNLLLCLSLSLSLSLCS